MSRYHPLPTAAGSSPAAFHNRFSSASVPLLSPRETFAAAIVVSAATASRVPATCAGSAPGPTMIRPRQSPAWSAHRGCHEFRLRFRIVQPAPGRYSPCAAVASACPAPWAITRTSMPVSLVNCGRMRASRPLFSTDVVAEASIFLAAPAALTRIGTCDKQCQRPGYGEVIRAKRVSCRVPRNDAVGGGLDPERTSILPQSDHDSEPDREPGQSPDSPHWFRA